MPIRATLSIAPYRTITMRLPEAPLVLARRRAKRGATAYPFRRPPAPRPQTTSRGPVNHSHAAAFAGGDDLPYDRELIRSGGASSRRDRDRRSADRAPRGHQARRRPDPRPRRRGSLRRTLGVILLVALVGVVVVGVLLGTRAAAFNASVSTAPFVSTALLGPLNGSDRVNVLMIGYGGGDHDGAYLADSMQVISIDPATDTTTSIPIPRDLWVEGIGAYPQNGKINEVFANGELAGGIDNAGDALAEVVSEVTGLRIDHWMSIDFAGFEEMVDATGGVSVNNPTPFCYTTYPNLHELGRWTQGCFEQGEIELNGEQALAYARARYTSEVSESTDFARSARQARIIGGLRSKLGEGGIGAIGPGLGLMDAMEGRLRTDLSVIDLFMLSGHLSADRRIELSEGPVLTATTNSIGQYILVPTGWTGPGDYGGLRAFLADALAQPIEMVPSAGADAP
jgi:LCP family protein required for cell wall assembly